MGQNCNSHATRIHSTRDDQIYDKPNGSFEYVVCAKICNRIEKTALGITDETAVNDLDHVLSPHRSLELPTDR